MNEQAKTKLITSLSLFFSGFILPVVFALIYGKSGAEIIKIGVFTSVFSIFLVYIFIFELKKDNLDNDNSEHIYRFLVVYSVSLICSLFFPFIDSAGWPFLAIAACLYIFSNAYIGLYAVSGLIMISSMLSNSHMLETFLVYIIASLIGIMIIRTVDENENVTISLFLSVFSLFILEIAGFVFSKNEKLSAEQFIMPIVNVAINTIFIFWILKYYNENVKNRYKNRYLELNDQEYSQLIKLKEKSKEEYFRSIHTAYLTERIATACNCNVDIAKNLAYYHRIKRVFSLSQNDVKRFVVENEFPPEAAHALIEFFDKNVVLERKEACIVFLCDKLIQTLMLIFEKNSKATVNYDEIIDTILDKPSINASLSNSDLSKKDYNIIREIMKKETLYYDFLR